MWGAKPLESDCMLVRLQSFLRVVPATCTARAYIQEDVVWSAFRVFDRNGDGKISKQELKAGSASMHDILFLR